MSYISKVANFFVVVLILISCNSVKTDNINKLKKKNLVLNRVYPPVDTLIRTHSEWTRGHYPKKIKEFKENPLAFNEIVFLGNSITEQGGDWGARFNMSNVKNRGIAGDTTDGVLARLGELIHYKPSKVFLLIGINDLFREDISSEYVYQNIISIVREIKNASPKTEIFVQTTLPTTTANLVEKIAKVNAFLVASESIEPYQLIDLHSEFAIEGDIMNMEYSTDGVHLNEAGYRIWGNKIGNIVNN